MGESKEKSFASQIQLLMETHQDFPQRFKQRLVFESSKVSNPFKFIGVLLSKRLLCDGSNHSEESFGLKEWMVQLAATMACSRGTDAIGGLVEALEETGNLPLISALQTWAQVEFGINVSDENLSEPKAVDPFVRTSLFQMSPKQAKNTIEMSSSAIKLIDKIISHEGKDSMKQTEDKLVRMASKIVNAQEFCSSLVHQGVLDESTISQAIKAACSKRAIASLVVALQRSDNESFIQEAIHWLETSQAKTKNYPMALSSLADQSTNGSTKFENYSSFFQQAAPSNDLEKVATFNFQPEFSTKGTCVLEFDKEKMVVGFPDGTQQLWNWINHEEKTTKFGDEVKTSEDITSWQYDEKILVFGTANGTVHLFDANTLEEKWSVRLGDPVHLLKFVESTLIVLAQSSDHDKFWWVDISRSDMRLLNQRFFPALTTNRNSGFLMDSVNTFAYNSNLVSVQYTKSGKYVMDDCLEAPADITTLNVVDLISTKRNICAGCENGSIAIWSTFLTESTCPYKTLEGHDEAIVSLCALKGHLLSLDQNGKLLMWSGYDLNTDAPIPRILSENFHNVTSLVAHERWFASASSADGTINIWTVPDLWLRTG